MTAAQIEQVSPGQFLLKGELNMRTVSGVYAAAQLLLAGARDKVTMDLAAVSRSDSAGVALLIAWLGLAQQQGFEMNFRNLPAQMLQIARVSELEPLLPISG